jgi:hypothetical protein
LKGGEAERMGIEEAGMQGKSSMKLATDPHRHTRTVKLKAERKKITALMK